MAREIASSSSLPRPRRSPRALWSRSERASNTAAKCRPDFAHDRGSLRAQARHGAVRRPRRVDGARRRPDPERTRARLERFYDAMSAEIEAAGGTIEKFVGDAVMAAFGAPEALEDHAERALHAALAMQRKHAGLFDEGLGLRIGVNTGEVVVGRAREGSSF